MPVVYILCYDDASEQLAHTNFGGCAWARVLRIEETSKYMEGVAYLGLLEERREEWKDADFVGTLSYRAPEKIDVPDMEAVCEKHKDADVIGLFVLCETVWDHASRAHPQFMDVWVPVIKKMGYTFGEAICARIPPFMANFWLAKPEWMSAFMRFYRDAVKTLETLPSVQEALWSDSLYETHLPVHVLEKVYQRSYMPLHPFIQERLAPFYFWTEHATIAIVPCNTDAACEESYGATREELFGRESYTLARGT